VHDRSEEVVAHVGRGQGVCSCRGGEPASSRSTMYSTTPAVFECWKILSATGRRLTGRAPSCGCGSQVAARGA
jgi:hypothetical protein